MKRYRLRSLIVTGALWLYFAGAFAAGYWVVFLIAGVIRRRRGIAWALGHYSGIFFKVARLLIPGLRIDVPERERLRRTSGSMVVCNHLSFLDPLLLLWLLPGLITVVRPDFFRVPVFGWLLRGAGFLGPHLFIEGQPWVDRVARHLRSGGNLLIFPEGTRSRDGQLARFKKGAFYLAKHLGAPILVLKVTGTDGLFPPGELTFNVAGSHRVELQAVASIDAADAADATTHELALRVFDLLSQS